MSSRLQNACLVLPLFFAALALALLLLVLVWAMCVSEGRAFPPTTYRRGGRPEDVSDYNKGYQACFSNDFINVPEGGPVDPVTQLHMEFCVNMTGYSTLGPFGGKGGGKGKIKGPKKKGKGGAAG
ncbi:uncharacterized protein LOC142345450 [Convolutriloba macropyga]|uniref:uncharacterized protein LOC142345450 n=1 Tax=Convolutriloba macropyga TaxID=536237 RepID=UPI003F524CEB